jgi:hypothetical protein
MDLEAISGPKQSDQSYVPVISDEPGIIVNSRALILKDETSPFETMYKWDVHDRVTISPEARRKYREFIARV